MSYDLSVLFPHQAFPEQEWRGILASFETPECHLRFGRGDSQDGWLDCDLLIDHSVLMTGVHRIELGYWMMISRGARWRAVLSTTAGRSFRAFWTQFAIPYHALVLIPGVIAQAEAERLFCQGESWLQFCRERLWNPSSQKEELVKHGFFSNDGTPRF